MLDLGLDGKIAIVTGGSDGLGRATALRLASEGCKVAICGRREDHLEAAAAAIAAATSAEILACRADVSSAADIDVLVGATVERFGGVDILVNNAALMVQIVGTPAMEYTRADWDRAFGVNVTGAWQCAKAVAPSMRERGGGRIVTGQVLNVDGGFIMRR
jgi:NAD(P)-dependent dehydrogenase (short-subunit alcohol dehydrogenase family)